MLNIIEEIDDIPTFVKKVVLFHCPIVEDRNEIANSLPEMDIHLVNKDGGSNIYFSLGICGFKCSTPNSAKAFRFVSVEEIESVIDYLLEDHHVFTHINIEDQGVTFSFQINWTNESISGISCGRITLTIGFASEMQRSDYLFQLFEKYFDKLKNTKSFQEMLEEYFSKEKEKHLNSLNREGMLSLLGEMTEEELRDILDNMKNETFVRLTQGKTQEAKSLMLKRLYGEKKPRDEFEN